MCSFLHRLVEEAPESEESGETITGQMEKNLPGGGNTCAVPLAWPCVGLIQGMVGRPGWWGERAGILRQLSREGLVGGYQQTWEEGLSRENR